MKRLFLALSVAAALWSAACGGGNSIAIPPPPVGKFSVANLNGQYAFVTKGESFTGGLSATPLARTGSFAADGAGNITGGVEDVNAAGATNLAVQITGGSYTVNADGRGTLTLLLGQSSINFGITLTSSSDGLMIDETSTSAQSSTGSGNFIKQNSGSFTVASVAGPYVFDFPGLDANNNPESFIGEFTANNGTISSGFFDDNDNSTLSSMAFTGTIAPDPLAVASLANSGRGVALIAGQNYVFYIVDSTRARFLSTDKGMLSGDAVAQSSNVPTSVGGINSSFVFIVAGSSPNGGITRVGRFTANGATITNVLEDTDDGGRFIQTNSGTNASISLDATHPGRGTFTFTDPNFASTPGKYTFYLSSATQGVIQETTLANNVVFDVADGSIVAQTGSPFSSSNIAGTYALNWSGLSLQSNGVFASQDEEDLVGQVNISGLNLAGAADIFQFQNGVPVFDLVASGSISIAGDGTGTSSSGSPMRNTMSIRLTKSNSTTVNFVVYFVNPQLAFFTNNQDSNRIVAGILKAQQ